MTHVSEDMDMDMVVAGVELVDESVPVPVVEVAATIEKELLEEYTWLMLLN